MNLGQRIVAALAAITGQTQADLEANSQADLTFREATGQTLIALGESTTALRTEVDALIERVNNSETINADDFAAIKAAVDSLDEAFPDTTTAPPEADPVEDPIEDNGSEPAEPTE